ncbi:TPA: NucA/NucB deoxyribonuclease domain-containing protein [Proteus mirabilis]
MGNVTQIKNTLGPCVDTPIPLSPQVTTFGYDKVGRMLFRENADYRTEYLYQPLSVTLRRVPMAIWHEAERTGTTARVAYQDALTFTYDKVGQLVREASARGDYQHHYDVLGNLTRTELPHQRAFEYLYYGSGHLQQMQWRENEQLTVLAEYQRDRLHRETLRTSGALDNETGYDCRGRITHQVARQMNASQFVTPVIDRRYRYAYAPNPLIWVDPWGQKGCKVTIGDKKTHDIVLTLTKSEYKEAFGHVADFITKKGNDIFTVDRTGATNRRRLSLQNYSTKTGFDRDEFPMAMFKEGGKGASVRYISISDNRGAGSSISHALSPYPDGTKVKIIVE